MYCLVLVLLFLYKTDWFMGPRRGLEAYIQSINVSIWPSKTVRQKLKNTVGGKIGLCFTIKYGWKKKGNINRLCNLEVTRQGCRLQRSACEHHCLHVVRIQDRRLLQRLIRVYIDSRDLWDCFAPQSLEAV